MAEIRNPTEVEAAIQQIRLELYRENIGGALEMAQAAFHATGDQRYRAQAEQIISWLSHLDDRDAYIRAQEAQYRRLRWKIGLKFLERRLRAFTGRKTRKLVRRRAAKPEFQLLEREVLAHRPGRVLDGGAGEGGAALALGSRHPDIRVEAVDVSATNVRLARQLNRFPNIFFHQGLLEEVHTLFEPNSFDFAYSFAVLEHVRYVDETIASILAVLRPGGRLCFEVPMHEFEPSGYLPEYRPIHGYCDHIRIFTEAELTDRFGKFPAFALHKIRSAPKPRKIPDFLRVIDFGSFFVAFSKP